MLTVIYLILGGIDYGFGPYTVKFPAEEGHVIFNISIIDDKILETNESFNLIIDQTSLLPVSGRVFAYSPYDRASVIIVEDDKSNYYQL